MTVKKITPYMKSQLMTLTPDELCEIIDKVSFTVEQRKALLKRLGEIERDPKSSPAEMKVAEQAKEILVEKKEPAKEPEPLVPIQVVVKKKDGGFILWL